jgi:hypothetical protein
VRLLFAQLVEVEVGVLDVVDVRLDEVRQRRGVEGVQLPRLEPVIADVAAGARVGEFRGVRGRAVLLDLVVVQRDAADLDRFSAHPALHRRADLLDQHGRAFEVVRVRVEPVDVEEVLQAVADVAGHVDAGRVVVAEVQHGDALAGGDVAHLPLRGGPQFALRDVAAAGEVVDVGPAGDAGRRSRRGRPSRPRPRRGAAGRPTCRCAKLGRGADDRLRGGPSGSCRGGCGCGRRCSPSRAARRGARR